MLLSLVQTTLTSPSPFPSYSFNVVSSTIVLPKTLFPGFGCEPTIALKRLLLGTTRGRKLKLTISTTTHASLLESPVLWAGRLCIFYALLKAGLAGSQANPLVSGLPLFSSVSINLWAFLFKHPNNLRKESFDASLLIKLFICYRFGKK